jgi:hypothetical protein
VRPLVAPSLAWLPQTPAPWAHLKFSRSSVLSLFGMRFGQRASASSGHGQARCRLTSPGCAREVRPASWDGVPAGMVWLADPSTSHPVRGATAVPHARPMPWRPSGTPTAQSYSLARLGRLA